MTTGTLILHPVEREVLVDAVQELNDLAPTLTQDLTTLLTHHHNTSQLAEDISVYCAQLRRTLTLQTSPDYWYDNLADGDPYDQIFELVDKARHQTQILDNLQRIIRPLAQNTHH